jgi:AraC-like DNA-binding protein
MSTKPRSDDERMTLSVVGILAREPLRVRLERPSIVVSLEACAVEVLAGAERFTVDRTSCLVVPRSTRVVLRSPGPAARVAILGVGEALMEAVARRHAKLGLERARLERWLAGVELLPRTVWVHEICHRYVFEREALDEHDNLATRFLEIEILKEIYYLFRDRHDGADRASAGQKYSPVLERAIAWIEAHLFAPRGLSELARRAGASESTLLRSFRRELGCAPGEYWRTRRLDESLVLLRTGRYSVAEVAARTGYDNPTSFGYAFRARFGQSPSSFVRRGPTRRAP